MMNLPVSVLAGGAWLDETMFTNLGTVAFGLMIVCSLLGIVYFVKQLSAPNNAAPAPVERPAPQYAPLSSAAAEPAPGNVAAPAADDGALVAVLTAAVAAVLDAEAAANGTVPPSFRVVSFQRSSRGRSWNGNR